MINLFKKFTPCKGIAQVVVLIALVNGGVNASTLNGVIEGNTLSWTNGMRVDSVYITPSNWQIISGLQPTTAWTPGTFIGGSPTTLILQGSAGGEVEIEIEIDGLQYNLGQAASQFSYNSTSSAPLFSTCGGDLDGSLATVIGDNCLAEGVYESDIAYTPFQFGRPLILLDEAVLIEAFQQADAVSGQYTGTMTVNPFYSFRSPTGTWTYRKAMSLPVTISLRYEASMLNNINVTGVGMITPTYDKEAQTVTGTTKFDITADGYFSAGLKLTFENNTEFELKNTDAQFPYSITCEQCDETTIVSKGVMQLLDEETVVSGVGGSISFDLKVHYDDIAAANIETGQYEDTFTVIFEENM